MKSFEERLEPIRTKVPVCIPAADGRTIAETIMVEVDAQRDIKDGEIYLSGPVLEELDRIKARHMGILLPSEIRELRIRLGMTQKEMGNLLGVAEKSYSRWETGRERLSHSLNMLVAALWEGRLTVADLQATRHPDFSWLERYPTPCDRTLGMSCRSQAIATSPKEEMVDEDSDIAA